VRTNSHHCAVLLKIDQRVYLAQVMIDRDKDVKDVLILLTHHQRVARSIGSSLREQILA
jgi:hypothetical protein